MCRPSRGRGLAEPQRPSTGPPTTPGTLRARPADRPAARPRPWPAGSLRWRSALTSAAPCAMRRRRFAGCFRTSRPGLWSSAAMTPPKPGTYAERDLERVVGPMARSARDLRLLLSVLEEGPLAAKAPPAELPGLRVGLWLDEPDFPVDAEVKAQLSRPSPRIWPAAGRAVELDPPGRWAGSAAGGLSPAARPPDRRGHAGRLRSRRIERLRGDGASGSRGLASVAGPGPAEVLELQTASHGEWLEANEARARFAQHLRGVFERLDVLIAPGRGPGGGLSARSHSVRAAQPGHCRTAEPFPYGAMLNWISMAKACRPAAGNRLPGRPDRRRPAGRGAVDRPARRRRQGAVDRPGHRGGHGRGPCAAALVQACQSNRR